MYRLYSILVDQVYKIVFLITAIVAFFIWVFGLFNKSHEEFNNIFNSVLSDPIALSIYEKRYVLALILFSLLIASALKIFLKLKKKWAKITQILDDINLIYIEKTREVSELLFEGGGTVDDAKYDLLAIKSNQYVQSSLNILSKIFQLYSGSECHVSIKTYEKTSKTVTTFGRDEGAIGKRKAIDEHSKTIPYSENTAFKKILDDPLVDCFVSNHLLLLKTFKKYENSHEKWWQFYTATIVAPVTDATHPAEINHETVYAFLCVDNKRGGFDNKSCKNLALSAARLYHYFFILLGKISK